MSTVQQEMQLDTTKASAKRATTFSEAEADRAIQMVKRKLSSRLSAEADVRRLILEATDEGNLSRMYCGMSLSVLTADLEGWAAFA
jgi:IS30 family transposase